MVSGSYMSFLLEEIENNKESTYLPPHKLLVSLLTQRYGILLTNTARGCSRMQGVNL
jgi:hypothetical protein